MVLLARLFSQGRGLAVPGERNRGLTDAREEPGSRGSENGQICRLASEDFDFVYKPQFLFTSSI